MGTDPEVRSTPGRGTLMTIPAIRTATPFLLALALGACAARQPVPAAPGVPAEAAGTAPAAQVQGPGFTEADVRFVQGMLAHHAQALVMTALVPERTDTRSVRLLAERIEVSQRDEIQQMVSWLRARGAEVPDLQGGHAHHAVHHAGMPGMLTAEQLAELTAARGAEFDRLFLRYMIQHHEGALVMVDQLLETPASGQEVDVFRIASEVAADQQAEIQRMQRLLAMLR